MAHNSQEPERAVQVLNEMYINPDLANVFINGIEGRHYEFKNKVKGIIGYPPGVDGSNVGYPSYPWAWPNEMISYVWEGDPEDIWTATSAWNKSAIESPAMGFTWDNVNVLNEVTACVNVTGKYEHALRAGALDPVVALPAFLKELNDAGINAIIAEKQRQLDAWLALKK
jgi:putative aldouronate transport system substrate-binding protein